MEDYSPENLYNFLRLQSNFSCNFLTFDISVTPSFVSYLNHHYRQNEAMLVPVRTLSEMKRKFGEEDKRISYLKVDVEGSEIKAGPTSNNLSKWRE